MKLSKHSKYYNKFFKEERNSFKEYFNRVNLDLSLLNIKFERDKYGNLFSVKGLTKVSKKLLQYTPFIIKEHETITSTSLRPDTELKYIELVLPVQDKEVLFAVTHTTYVIGFYENDDLFFENGILYKPCTHMSTEVHDSIKWDHQYTEEELFQESLLHDMNIPLLQEIKKIHDKFCNMQKVTVLNIYKEFHETK